MFDIRALSFLNEPIIRLTLLFSLISLWAYRKRSSYIPQLIQTSSAKDDKKELTENSNITFSDVAGLDEIKDEMNELCDFLVDPTKYMKIGAKIPKGVLFYGPPGTGKTLMAKALAGETKASFIYASGSEFVEKFVGIGASRIRSLFEKAKKSSPSIIFIDELDAIGISRSVDNNSERDQTLNQLLVELDGFNNYDNVIVIAATNRMDILDKALLRPGRFDRHVYVGNPSVKAREDILKVHFKNKPMNRDINLNSLAKKTHGMSGAHLANVINEAALLTVRKNLPQIGNDEINQALVKTVAGLKNKTTILNDKERDIIAFHEGGHALVGSILNNDLIEKISIVPHGKALGFVLNASSEDSFILTKEDLLNKISVLLAGRAAEEIIFHEISTGAQNDLVKANEIASLMVCEYGMSQYKNKTFNLREDFTSSGLINEEINSILSICYSKANDLIYKNMDKLNRLAAVLIQKETINGVELETILKSA
ncbi:ATP-dependent zinc metalloprotease FtsH [Alkalibaculum sp. M08DMB]|uniref:ATP-dependent zinc metalloprotease FtsH n=2 Tax=Alkalibaculum sporogenes TaxID=2655001 RepID=A0A6A7K6S4_9FIRM|nr:ATP-dependent zinc metalloprotease FtsH [Alkalibaculum sporogenes]